MSCAKEMFRVTGRKADLISRLIYLNSVIRKDEESERTLIVIFDSRINIASM